MSWIGRSLRRFEDPALLLGRGRFTGDAARGAAAVRFVRSAVARGRIKSISKPPGALVFTAEDLKEVKPIRPLLHRPDYVAIEHPVLARGRVNHVGEALAVVVADDAAMAEDIAEAVEADIVAEDAVVDVDCFGEMDCKMRTPWMSCRSCFSPSAGASTAGTRRASAGRFVVGCAA